MHFIRDILGLCGENFLLAKITSSAQKTTLPLYVNSELFLIYEDQQHEESARSQMNCAK